jgi:hypothetical protein
MAAALAVCSAAALEEPEAAAAVSLAVTLAEPETVAVGAAVGSATPEGQCQWSPWGSQVLEVASWSWSSSSSSWLWVDVGAEVTVAEGATTTVEVRVVEAVSSAASAAEWLASCSEVGGVVGSGISSGQCLGYRQFQVLNSKCVGGPYQ